MIRILIADDIAENRYMLETLLKGNGYEVVTTSNGAEALASARTRPPDIIISDILMPVMDGFALCRQWKADERLKKVPFIIYTATYTEPKDEAFALSLGADRFLVKPKKPEELVAMLREILDDAGAERLVPREQEPKEEREFLQDYNATLFRKLEKKMEQLEGMNESLRQEVAERRRIEEELRYRNSVLATQQETSLDGILIVDDDGRIVSFNKRFVEMWGIPDQAILARSDDLALKSVLEKVADSGQFLDKVKHLYEHKELTSRDLIELTDHRLFDRYSSPITGGNGEYYGRIWYFRDITEQKLLEEQLRQAQKMEAIGTLAGGVAHDFNNVLSTILGYASLVQKKMPSKTNLAGYVDEILSATKRAAGLTKSLLAFGRKQPMERTPVDLNGLVHGFQRMMARLINEDIEFTVNCDTQALMVHADPGQVEQVLMNLINNARDAMPRGGKLMIATNSFVTPTDQNDLKSGAYAMIAVSDTGCGIPRELQGRIFEPFVTTKAADRGTGLGLAMAYGIIKNHDGVIRVHSETGKGTTFKIYLPLTGEALPAAEGEEAELLPRGCETVLLVEDNAHVRLATADMLREFGYTVLEAADGEDALKVFNDHADEVYLVLCDLIMPKRSGKDTFEELSRQRPGIKAIFTSGYTADILTEKGILEEGIHFLSKPISMIDLIKKVRAVLDE